MDNVEKIFNFYMLANKLKTTLRTGWIHWNVENTRIESVAEHVYGTIMLAVSIYANCGQDFKDLDFEKVALMIAIHETEEILIGDITMFEYQKVKNKKEAGRKAVQQIFQDCINKEKFLNIIAEYENRNTNEAKFAYMCDKLEADIQAYIYRNNFNLEKANPICLNDERILKMNKQGINRVEQYFFENDKAKFSGIFEEMANFLQNLEKNK